MITSCEAMIQYLYSQFKVAIDDFSTDDDRYVDIDNRGNLVSLATSVNLAYIPRPSYHIDLGMANSSLVIRRKGYDLFDTLPRLAGSKLRFPLISLSDFDNEEMERVITPFGALPKWIIGSDDKVYVLGNYYFFNSFGQAVKVEEVALAQQEDETLAEALNSIGGLGDILKIPFFLSRRGKKRWKALVDLKGGDLEKLIFIAGELVNSNFR